MQTYDPEKAVRVWQRVQGQQEKEFDAQLLPEMIAREWADATTYLILSRRFQGKESAVLRQMFEQEQDHASCLKGLYTLMTGQRPIVHSPGVPQESTEVLLRRCYGEEMRCLAQYEARCGDPEYGQVFSRLAQQEREHCHTLLWLLGRMKPKK